MPTQGQAPVTPTDRLSFTLFVAAVVHAVIILGVGFAPNQDSRAASNTLEVTIAQQRAEETPEDAEFLAQADQEGSGDEEEEREVTTDRETDFADPEVADVQLEPPGMPEERDHQPQELVVTTHDTSPRRVDSREPEDTVQDVPVSESESLEDLSREIASLQARLDEQRQTYAKRPRRNVLSANSTMAHHEALYLNAFRREVEEMGTRHFPDQALARNIFGNVRLLVALDPDGEVREIEVLQSSGHAFLDEAARQSVRLAAPFAPFTEEMRDDTDILEIIRTWRFDRRERVTTRAGER